MEEGAGQGAWTLCGRLGEALSCLLYTSKVGVGEKPKGWDLADYVLGHFSKEDRGLVDDALKRAAGAVELMVQGEVDQAMNQFN